MLWNAKNGCVKIGDTDMNYVSFGYGSKAFIVLPGLSEGLVTVKGKALKELGITRVSVMGVSQGGMIAQFLAIDYPELAEKLIIVVCAPRVNEIYEELNKIVCPTYITGGDEDKTVGVNGSYEMKEKIERSEMYIYEGLGHAAYEEAKDFYSRVYDFKPLCRKDNVCGEFTRKTGPDKGVGLFGVYY